ncbi:MAG: hypothetical protein HC768_13370 [Acaryochloris sp. CRU_2_0]|nr:hypothetical protein [Acaryochloris sp. CRU_2_0]
MLRFSNEKSLSVHDNFFEIGGHSLLAILICSRLRETFDLEVPIRTLFESPTAAELSAEIERLMTTETVTTPVVPTIAKISRDQRRASFSSEHELQLSETLKTEISKHQLPNRNLESGSQNPVSQ